MTVCAARCGKRRGEGGDAARADLRALGADAAGSSEKAPPTVARRVSPDLGRRAPRRREAEALKRERGAGAGLARALRCRSANIARRG